jgi:hypothetical protein
MDAAGAECISAGSGRVVDIGGSKIRELSFTNRCEEDVLVSYEWAGDFQSRKLIPAGLDALIRCNGARCTGEIKWGAVCDNQTAPGKLASLSVTGPAIPYTKIAEAEAEKAKAAAAAKTNAAAEKKAQAEAAAKAKAEAEKKAKAEAAAKAKAEAEKQAAEAAPDKPVAQQAAKPAEAAAEPKPSVPVAPLLPTLKPARKSVAESEAEAAAAPETQPAEPEKTDAEPEKKVTEPEKMAAEPEKKVAEPEKLPAEPEKMAAAPEKMAAEPEEMVAEPEKPAAEPEVKVAAVAPQPAATDIPTQKIGRNPVRDGAPLPGFDAADLDKLLIGRWNAAGKVDLECEIQSTTGTVSVKARQAPYYYVGRAVVETKIDVKDGCRLKLGVKPEWTYESDISLTVHGDRVEITWHKITGANPGGTSIYRLEDGKLVAAGERQVAGGAFEETLTKR